LSLDAFVDELQSQTVSWFTDNQNVVSIVNKGSKVSKLNSISLDIFQKCTLNVITIDVNWIPGDLTHVADGISKIIDYHDYKINDDIFAFLNQKWGPIQLIALRAITIVNYFYLTQSFFSRERAALMLLVKIGHLQIIGYALLPI